MDQTQLSRSSDQVRFAAMVLAWVTSVGVVYEATSRPRLGAFQFGLGVLMMVAAMAYAASAAFKAADGKKTVVGPKLSVIIAAALALNSVSHFYWVAYN
jgi:hypothetical protein